jgi:hypothetical protein
MKSKLQEEWQSKTSHFLRCLHFISVLTFSGKIKVCASFQHPKSIITNQKLERTIHRLVESETTGQKTPNEITVIRIEPVE